MIIAELQRLANSVPEEGLTLIGRRSTRSNNTWLRNLPALNKGSDLCELYIHPADAKAHGIADGSSVIVTGPGGVVTAKAKVTDDIAQSVVCLPHGFEDGSEINQNNLAVGPNYNRLAGTVAMDKPSGTAALNGIPVTVLANLV